MPWSVHGQTGGMVQLRLLTEEDSAPLAELRVRNRAYLTPWEPERPDEFFSVRGQRTDIQVALARHERGDAVPFVILDDKGAMAGRLTLSGIVRGPFQSCALGYWVSEDRTGKGIATTAVTDAVTYAFHELGLHRVQAETLLANAPSQRVLERNGFAPFGLAPRYLRIAGRWQDHLLFQRLAEADTSGSGVSASYADS